MMAAVFVALIVASGAAGAADILPIIAATVPSPIAFASATGPQIAIEIDKTLSTDLDFDPFGIDFDTDLDFKIDIERSSGWGLTFFGNLGADIEIPLDAEYRFHVGVYRAMGNVVVGAYAGVHGDVPGGVDFFELGGDIEFSSGNLVVYNETWIEFDGSLFVWNNTEAEYNINERLLVGGAIELGFGGGPILVEIEAWAELDLGNITPYVFGSVVFPLGFFEVEFGIDLERPIGSGPFSLIGNLEFGVGTGGLDVDASIGIRYSRGDVR